MGHGEGEGTQRHCQVFLRYSHYVIVFSIQTCTPDGVRKRQVIRLLLLPTATPRLPDDGDGKLDNDTPAHRRIIQDINQF
jgi:hypothetical protein